MPLSEGKKSHYSVWIGKILSSQRFERRSLLLTFTDIKHGVAPDALILTLIHSQPLLEEGELEEPTALFSPQKCTGCQGEGALLRQWGGGRRGCQLGPGASLSRASAKGQEASGRIQCPKSPLRPVLTRDAPAPPPSSPSSPHAQPRQQHELFADRLNPQPATLPRLRLTHAAATIESWFAVPT